jgi:predicted RND superfamily exporter protein
MHPDLANVPGSLTHRFVRWTLRHGKVLWALAVLLAIPAAWRTVHLYSHLRSDIEELLPREAPSVVAIDELRRRVAGLQYLGVLVEVGNPDRLRAGEQFLDDLAARVRRYPKTEVSDVRTGLAAERTFVEKHAASLIQLDDLKLVRQRIDDRLHWEYAKTTGTLLDEKEPAPSLDFSDIEHKYASQVGGGDLEASGRFSSRRLGYTLMLIEVGGFSTSANQAAALIDKVRADMRALGGAERYAPGMRVGLTGDVAIAAEEMSALVTDLTVSSLLVVVVVVLAIVLFYGWLGSVPALFLPLCLAAVGAFALASLPPFNITELNSNTAFLGSIIIGNGINFGIIQLARYVEARRAGRSVEEALALALWGTRMGTLSAAVAAGVAYASLVAMQFRGFRQFGVIGGLGMVLAWLTTFVLMPPLIAWLDSGHGSFPAKARASGRGLMARIAAFVAARPRSVVLGALALTLAAAFEVRRFGRDQLEYDFSHLRRRDTWRIGEGYWGRKMDALLDRYLTPTAILTDTVAEARAIAAKVRDPRATPALAGLISSVRTYDDVVPPDEDEKAAEVAGIRRKITGNVRAAMTAADLKKLERLVGTGTGDIPRIQEAEVPEVLTRGLRERDGSAGRAVLIYPNPTATWWRGETITGFVQALRDVAQLPVTMGGRPARVAGGPPLSADIIASMERDGPLASVLAFVGVMATVVLIFRWGIATPFVIGSLVVGVLWLVAATMWLGIKINFINFIAFPITFGIGVDYAVNVMARYLRDGQRDVVAAVRGTGGAVGLCSLTTIVGYSSLLVAQNVGLFLFGLLAVFGEIACLTTAIIVLPAVLLLIQPKRRPKRQAFEWDPATSPRAEEASSPGPPEVGG